MYWSIAITSKVRDPVPREVFADFWPTLYSNVVVMLGLLCQATLVGAASSVVQNMDSQAAEYNRRLQRIKSYLSFKRVPASLQRRVLLYYRHLWSSMGDKDEALVMPDLPSSLKCQMDILQTRMLFVRVSIFHACDAAEILQLVRGLTSLFALPGNVLVEQGKVGEGLYFIMRGEVEFLFDGAIVGTRREGFFGEDNALYGLVAAETVRATTYSDFYLLPSEVFLAVVEENDEMRKRVEEFAQHQKRCTTTERCDAEGAPASRRGPAPWLTRVSVDRAAAIVVRGKGWSRKSPRSGSLNSSVRAMATVSSAQVGPSSALRGESTATRTRVDQVEELDEKPG